MQIVQRKILDLIPYINNSRTHSDEQIIQISSSIKEFGFTNPILTDGDNGVIAGHARLMAAKKLGMEEVPTIELSHLSEAQKKAYIIADNKLALNSGWDDARLAIEFAELEALDFDLELTGFSLDEIAAFDFDEGDETEGLTDPDEVPELPEEPVSKLGDVWLLGGKHRVMCGDSTKIEDVEKLMAGKKADVLLTDPPYGIKRDKGFEGFEGFGGFGKPIARRQYTDDWDNDRPSKECFDLLLLLTKSAFIFGGNYFADHLPQGKHWIVWDKKNTMPTFGDAELIWTNIERDSVKIKTFQFNGLLGKEKERFHPTQKPVELLVDLTNEYTEKNNIILDGFLGSGTTLIACEKTNRICYGMEISPHYTDVICQRFLDFTGVQPILESTGQTFIEVKEAMNG